MKHMKQNQEEKNIVGDCETDDIDLLKILDCVKNAPLCPTFFDEETYDYLLDKELMEFNGKYFLTKKGKNTLNKLEQLLNPKAA